MPKRRVSKTENLESGRRVPRRKHLDSTQRRPTASKKVTKKVRASSRAAYQKRAIPSEQPAGVSESLPLEPKSPAKPIQTRWFQKTLIAVIGSVCFLGFAGFVIFTLAKDTAPPAIQSLSPSDITETSVVINWKTDEPATSQVEYGITAAYGLTTPLNEKLATNHSIILTGLKPSTTYYFRVKSKDAIGNEATSEGRTFTTVSVAPPPIEVGPQIGKRAPDFTLPTLDGREVGLSQFQGKIVMVNFWQASCSACRNEMPHIEAVYKKWPREKLEILAVSVGERAAFVQSFVDRQGLTFPVLLDSEEAISAIYEVDSYPTTFFINADGIIKKKETRSFRSPEEVESILRSL